MYTVKCSCKFEFGMPETHVVVTPDGAMAKKMFMCPDCVKRHGVGAKLTLVLDETTVLAVTSATSKMEGVRADTFNAWNKMGTSLIK